MRKEIRVGEQTVVFDRDSTIALYADAITRSRDDEADDCLLWKNFDAQRTSLYPQEFVSLLNELGADPLKDVGASIFECEPGQFHSQCGGHFLFAGELVEGTTWRPERRSNSCTFWFTHHFPHAGLPRNLKLCAIEFCSEIPSVVEKEHGHPRKPTASLGNLDDKERRVIRECLQATVEGPFYPEWEFRTIFGLERDDVRRILECWPRVNEADGYVVLAINNSLNNILFYPAKSKKQMWPKFISASPAEVAGILDKWRGRAPRRSLKPRDHFDDSL